MTREQIQKRIAILRQVERERLDNLLIVRAQIAEREWELREMDKAEAVIEAEKEAQAEGVGEGVGS